MTRFRLSAILVLFIVGLTICITASQESYKVSEEENTRLKGRLQAYEHDMQQIQLIKADREITEIDKTIYNMKTHIQDQLMHKSNAYRQHNTSRNPRFNSFLAMDRQWVPSDDPKTFFGDRPYVTNINGLPTFGKSSVIGWSGSYWPMRNGGISARYPPTEMNTIGQFDPNTRMFLSFYNWAKSVSMYAQPADHLAYSGSASYAKFIEDNYSPAEKYDLLIGDYKFTMTNFAKNEGAKWQYNGDVVGWFGICHGWAPAATYYPAPLTSVYATAVNGMTIKFFPDDIKALVSQFWAYANFTTLFAGNRCPFYPNQPGFLSEDSCRSLNAGTFITILGNHVGLLGKSITFDPTTDPEIWNHPVNNYTIRYFNPLTNDFFTSASGAKVPVSSLQMTADTFLNYVATVAAPGTASVVGFFIKINYTNETPQNKLIHGDTTEEPIFETKEYEGFLDLDANDNIVGGEWKYTAYPQYLWYYDESKTIETDGDVHLPRFLGSALGLTDLASTTMDSSNKGQILKSIADYLAYTSAGYSFSYR